MSILDQIVGVQEAAEMWGLSPDHVKKLCRDGEVAAKKIGKTWVVMKGQDNPKQRGLAKMKQYWRYADLRDNGTGLAGMSHKEAKTIMVEEMIAAGLTNEDVETLFEKAANEYQKTASKEAFE